MNKCTRTSSTVSIEVQISCRRANESCCAVTTYRNTSSLILPHKEKKSNCVRLGDRGGHRNGASLSIQKWVYVIFGQSCSRVQKYSGAPS
ncbi:hypothetical protein TNCV_2832211 [Trichonephila clavipes]|nr:hypothetical protein TNCV_2832211 [Trichonephila clavipes]